MADQIIQVNKKMAAAERDKLEATNVKVPIEVLNLTKTEQELRIELCNMLSECNELQERLKRDMKRLRREHYGNLQDIAQLVSKLESQSGKVNSVCDR